MPHGPVDEFTARRKGKRREVKREREGGGGGLNSPVTCILTDVDNTRILKVKYIVT